MPNKNGAVQILNYLQQEYKENYKIDFTKTELMEKSGIGTEKALRAYVGRELRGVIKADGKGGFELTVGSFEGGRQKFLSYLEEMRTSLESRGRAPHRGAEIEGLPKERR